MYLESEVEIMKRKVIPFDTYTITDYISIYLSSIEEKLDNEEWHYIKDLLENNYDLRALCTIMYYTGYDEASND